MLASKLIEKVWPAHRQPLAVDMKSGHWKSESPVKLVEGAHKIWLNSDIRTGFWTGTGNFT